MNRDDNLTIGVCYRSPAAYDKESTAVYKVIENTLQGNVVIMRVF